MVGFISLLKLLPKNKDDMGSKKLQQHEEVLKSFLMRIV